MKTVIITGDNWLAMGRGRSFLDRADVRRLTAVSNAEAFSAHAAERADLIIADLDSPGMGGEELCARVRESEPLRSVSIIIISPGDVASVERSLTCRANEILTRPVNREALLIEAHRLLNVAMRTSVRTPVGVSVQGKFKGMPFMGSSVNISASGMLLEAGALMGEGDRLSCVFLLPGGAQVLAKAEVVRVESAEREDRPFRYGLRFLSTSKESETAIEGFVDGRALKA